MNYPIFSKYFTYTLELLDELKRSNRPLSAGCMSIPRSYVVKIAPKLLKCGLIISKEGRNGGYILVPKVNLSTALMQMFGEKSVAQAINIIKIL